MLSQSYRKSDEGGRRNASNQKSVQQTKVTASALSNKSQNKKLISIQSISQSSARLSSQYHCCQSLDASKPASNPDLEDVLRPIISLPNPISDLEAKLYRTQAFYARWKIEDEKDNLARQEIVTHQKQRCRDIGLIVFSFTLRDAQVEAIQTLFYKQRDLLLLVKTGFGKSLIFQLIPFILDLTDIVIILMPLKLLQAEQNAMINCILNGKAIALTGENNLKAVQQAIATEGYTYVFQAPKLLSLRSLKPTYSIIVTFQIGSCYQQLMKYTQQKNRIKAFARCMLKLIGFEREC